MLKPKLCFCRNGKRVLGLALRHTKFQHKKRKQFFMTKQSAEAMSAGVDEVGMNGGGGLTSSKSRLTR